MKVEADWPAALPCKIAIVGEAPGGEEAAKGSPFVGYSGRLLNEHLTTVGINRYECLVTNVFTERPPNNDEGFFFTKKSLWKKQNSNLPPKFNCYGTAGFLSPQYYLEIERLKNEIERAQPNLIVALGSLALWALTGFDKISNYRGFIIPCELVKGPKVLPTYHPAAVMRQWSFNPIMMHDLKKAKDNSNDRAIVRPNRTIYINPTYGDLLLYEQKFIRNAVYLVHDIETEPEYRFITCIGLSTSPTEAIVIPFIDYSKPDLKYWNDYDFKKVLLWLRRVLSDRTKIKVAQNMSYDLTWERVYGIVARGPNEDTMLMHHAMQPELPKSLGFLASVYSNEGPWKQMVSFKKSSQNKKGA